MKSINNYLSKSIFLYYAFLILTSPCMFLANITEYSPIYFLFVIACFLFILFFINNNSIYLDNNLRLLICIVFIIGFYRFINYCLFSANFKNNMLQYLSFFYFCGTLILSKRIDKKELSKFVSFYFLVADFFLLFDFGFRFVRRSDSYSGILFFYNFKTNGLMFQDSNFSAFLGMINFGAKLYFKQKLNKNMHIFRTFVLTVLNLSRASWVGMIIAVMVYLFFKANGRKRIYQILFYISCFLIVSFYIFTTKINDYSFLTKFEIFNATFYVINNSSVFNLFFGYGVESSKDILKIGFSAHNYFSRDFIELGFIAVFLHSFLYICIFIVSRGAFSFILFPYLIAGLSMAPSIMPYFFTLAGCILVYEHKNKYLLKGDYESCKLI